MSIISDVILCNLLSWVVDVTSVTKYVRLGCTYGLKSHWCDFPFVALYYRASEVSSLFGIYCIGTKPWPPRHGIYPLALSCFSATRNANIYDKYTKLTYHKDGFTERILLVQSKLYYCIEPFGMDWITALRASILSIAVADTNCFQSAIWYPCLRRPLPFL